ncbi:MAG: patatin-like phospholipase family protein, partial [Candidatus Competibacteraceae bacterium]|nr:patatin-like phospholipase family protein [Candidatus Competibacteraceae bacterium]
MESKSIAIACQGGGSHTAFTAGVLTRLLEEKDLPIRALSGTSGGAICALLAWYGLLLEDRARGRELLEAFWADNAAVTLWDRFLNHWLVAGARLRGTLALPEISPYQVPDFAQEQFRALLEKHVDFPGLKKLIGPGSPDLYVGAVEVCTGRFHVFHNQRVTVQAILASAAIPNLFRAVKIGPGPDQGLYWDGLFSQNPPVADLARSQPDEIWVIQINPSTTRQEPRSVDTILDRRNELAGNLSLEQELRFIEKI